jgi:hypothetical protein
MSWVVFEVLLAFGLAVFIVWWTLPRKKKKKAPLPAGETQAPSTAEKPNN